MQNRVLYTYALAKSLHENGGDVLDVFVPFILKVLMIKNEVLEKNDIKILIKEEFCLEIPSYTIGTIITRAKRKGYIEQKEGKLYLTDQGKRAQNTVVNHRDVERDKNNFIKSLAEYLGKKGIILSRQEVATKLKTVINSNLCSLVTYLGEEPQLSCNDQLNKKESREIISFFKEIEESDKFLFNILKNIIMGSIICTMVKKDQASLNTKLRPARVFLDTNIIFSLLGYHHQDIALPVKELFNLLKSNGYTFFVFPFTIKEIIRVLNNFRYKYKEYNSLVKVNSIYNRLRYLGLTPTDMTEIIANIEIILRKKKIKIYPLSSQDLKINDKDLLKLKEYKSGSNQYSLKHDLYAIKGIQKLRGKEVRRLEKANAFFLSSDQKLTEYNFKENGHKINSTINDVILDQLMTNILWFKKPNVNSNLPLNAVMSLHADKLFVDNDVWRRFQFVVKSMKEAEKLSEDELSIILYNDKIEGILLDYEGSVDEIDEIFVEELVEKSKKLYREREEIFNFQQEENMRLNKENEEALELVKTFTEKLYLIAGKKSERFSNTIIYCLIPLFLLLISFLVWVSSTTSLGVITTFLSTLAIAISIGIIPKINFKEKIKIKLNRYFLKQLKNTYFPNKKLENLNRNLMQELASSQQELKKE